MYNYRINNPERFSLGWYDRNKLKQLSKDDLVRSDNECYSIVTKQSKNSFSITDVGFCKLDGAFDNRTYYTSSTNVSFLGLCTKSRTYNKDKIQTNKDGDCTPLVRDLTEKYHSVAQEKIKQNALRLKNQ